MKEKPKVSVIMPILITEKWQAHMTRCAIDTMFSTTKVPFELCIVETGEKWADDLKIDGAIRPIKYEHRPEKTTVVKDLNRAIEMTSGDIIVHTANDVMMRPGWLEALLECFAIPDCGVATLAASDLKHMPQNKIVEGIYGPMYAFKKGWKFDEAFENIFSDTDMIMRIYNAGFRSYRNWRVVITHLYQQTFTTIDSKAETDRRFEHYKRVFSERHKGNPLIVYKALSEGYIL